MTLGSFGISSNGGSGGSSIPSEDISYGVASGTNTYTVTTSPAITAYGTGGLFLEIKFTNANTSSTVTLDVDGLGAKTILNANGGLPYIGQISAGGLYYLTYDGTNLILTNDPYDGDISSYRKTGTTTLERWYTTTSNGFSPVTVSFALNLLKAAPFVVPKTITLDRIGMEITSAGTAGSLVRLGIYRSSNGLPTGLVLDAGTIAGDSATFQSITINQQLTAGLYFLAALSNSVGSITFRAIPIASTENVLGVAAALGTAPAGNFIQSTFTYAALPDPFDNTGIVAFTANVPIISVRLSA